MGIRKTETFILHVNTKEAEVIKKMAALHSLPVPDFMRETFRAMARKNGLLPPIIVEEFDKHINGNT